MPLDAIPGGSNRGQRGGQRISDARTRSAVHSGLVGSLSPSNAVAAGVLASVSRSSV